MAVGDYWDVRIYSVFGDQTAVNALLYRVTAAGAGEVTPTAVADAVGGAIGPDLRACLVVDASFHGVGATRIFPAVSPVGSSIVGAGVGTFSPNAGARQVSGIIRKQSGLGGRRGRGRVYVPFPAADASDVNTGRPNILYVGALNDLAGTITGPIVAGAGANTATLSLAIHRRDNVALSPLVDFCTGSLRWGTQKRRGDYGRPNFPPF